jgi:hypothetical protein
MKTKWDGLTERQLDHAVVQVEADIQHMTDELTQIKIERRRKRAMRRNDETRVRRDG